MGSGGGGPDTVTSTSTGNTSGNSTQNSSSSSSGSIRYPDYVLPYAQQFMNAYGGLVLPGGKVAPSPYAYNEVAPWTVPQMQAAQAIGAYGATSPLTQGAQIQQANTIAGNYLGPDKNPALKSYYDAAADALTQQYKFATDPSLLAHGAQTGTLVSSPMVQQNQLARYNLGQNLANLGAGIYEPAYQYERGLQQQASMNTPSLVASQYIPSQMLMNLGQQEQQQAQNVLNTATGNLTTLGLWPYQALNMLGGALGPAAGPGQDLQGSASSVVNTSGSTTSNGSQTGPNPFQTMGGSGGAAGGIGLGILGGLGGGLGGGGGGGGK